MARYAAPKKMMMMISTLSLTQQTPYALSNKQFADACKLRLGITVGEEGILCPRCVTALSAPGDSFKHLCMCYDMRKKVQSRHNTVCFALQDVIRRSGLQCELEPFDRQEEEHCRPDGYIYGLRPGKRVAFDVSIAHPGSSVLRSVPIHAPAELKAARRHENHKHHKLGPMMEHTADDFVSVAIETFGAFGLDARNLITELGGNVTESERPDFLAFAYAHLSCALMQGNAAIWEAGERVAQA